MTKEFKKGDIVTLKSGGPDMTIEEYPCSDMGIKYDDKAKCVWFDGKKVCRDTFYLDVLEKA